MTDPLPPEDTVEEFAADLRHYRVVAGSPTLAALGHATGLSRTILSEAFSGKRLPSARTVAALAEEFDVDVRAVLRRRDALDAAVEDVPSTPEVTRQGDKTRRGQMLGVAAASFVAGAVIAATVTGFAMSGQAVSAAHPAASSPSPSPTPTSVARSGQDPANLPCVNDAAVVASATRAHQTQLQIIYSAVCHAAWARITRYDGKSTGNEVSASIYRNIAPHAADRQSTTEPDAQSAYTTLLVRPTPATELCAVGSITLSGATISLGPPLCL